MTTAVAETINKMNLPEEFIAELKRYGSQAFDGLTAALALSPSVSVRCNAFKGIDVPLGRRKVAWCDNGFYLDEREAFTFDPAMHQGLYYVQDASSMIINHIAKQLTDSTPVRYLDACAAPGGKTTAAIDALPFGSLVVANEYNSSRASVLRENVIKWGYPSCVVSRGDTARFRRLPAFFDIVAADVPCSGEGMFRKDPEAVAQWSPALVDECVVRQREIVDNLWETLRPGGYFVYSTCTFNRKENEEMIEYLRNNHDAESINMNFPEEWNIAQGIDTGMTCYRFMPHRVDGEGLFVAVLRKPEAEGANHSSKKEKSKIKAQNKPLPQLAVARTWIADAETMEFEVNSETTITSFPSVHKDALRKLTSTLDVIHAGILVGTIKGKDLIPAQSLALSLSLSHSAFPRCEIDFLTAIAYLRHEAITLPDDTPKGYILLTYKNSPLGFVKNLGNRANNLYPQEWRILSTHIPTTPPSLLY